VFTAAILSHAAAIIACHYVARYIMTVMWRRSLCGRDNIRALAHVTGASTEGT
jgi:hypothetical protein